MDALYLNIDCHLKGEIEFSSRDHIISSQQFSILTISNKGSPNGIHLYFPNIGDAKLTELFLHELLHGKSNEKNAKAMPVW